MTHDKENDFPGVRLAAAGCLCLLLLVWVGFFDDSWQNAFMRMAHGHRDPSMAALITGSISLLIFTVLFPVAYRGRTADRWLAALLALVPSSLFLLTALGSYGPR